MTGRDTPWRTGAAATGHIGLGAGIAGFDATVLGSAAPTPRRRAADLPPIVRGGLCKSTGPAGAHFVHGQHRREQVERALRPLAQRRVEQFPGLGEGVVDGDSHAGNGSDSPEVRLKS